MANSCLDFNADGFSDIALANADRFGNVVHHLFLSDSSMASINFGSAGDIAASAEYDSKPGADIATVRLKKAVPTWFIRDAATGSLQALSLKKKADYIISGADFDGDHRADPAGILKNKLFYLSSSMNYARFSARVPGLGQGTIHDLTADDVDGDGRADLIVLFEPAKFKADVKVREQLLISSPTTGRRLIKQTAVKNARGVFTARMASGDAPILGLFKRAGASLTTNRLFLFVPQGGQYVRATVKTPKVAAITAGSFATDVSRSVAYPGLTLFGPRGNLLRFNLNNVASGFIGALAPNDFGAFATKSMLYSMGLNKSTLEQCVSVVKYDPAMELVPQEDSKSVKSK